MASRDVTINSVIRFVTNLLAYNGKNNKMKWNVRSELATPGCGFISSEPLVLRNVSVGSAMSPLILKLFASKHCTGSWFVLPKITCDRWHPKLDFGTRPHVTSCGNGFKTSTKPGMCSEVTQGNFVTVISNPEMLCSYGTSKEMKAFWSVGFFFTHINKCIHSINNNVLEHSFAYIKQIWNVSWNPNPAAWATRRCNASLGPLDATSAHCVEKLWAIIIIIFFFYGKLNFAIAAVAWLKQSF